jgi:septal ring factor EnvC (AmiA/AmiB activator)
MYGYSIRKACGVIKRKEGVCYEYGNAGGVLCMRTPFLLSAVFVLSLSLLPWGLSAQGSPPDFSSIDSNLEELENLITNTLNNSETLMRQLEDLSLTLNERERLISEQENLLTELQKQLHEMSETYRTLSQYSKSLEAKSKFWEPEPGWKPRFPSSGILQ